MSSSSSAALSPRAMERLSEYLQPFDTNRFRISVDVWLCIMDNEKLEKGLDGLKVVDDVHVMAQDAGARRRSTFKVLCLAVAITCLILWSVGMAHETSSFDILTFSRRSFDLLRGHEAGPYTQLTESALNPLEALRVQYDLPALAALSFNSTDVRTAVTGRRNAYVATSPVTVDDVFKLGSNTKAMTSTLLARIMEESTYPRKLTWDTTIPIALLFSGVIIHPGHYRTTLAQIAAHRSGIVDGTGGIPPEFAKLWDPRLSPQEGRRLVIEAALRDAPATTPGSEFSYSNTGYMLLGFIIESLAQQPYEDLLQQKLFDPLSMTSCGFGVSPPLSSPTAVENPWPHTPSRFGPVPSYPNALADIPLAMGPAGSVYCDMKDYAKFLQLHIDGFHGRPNRILRFNGFAKLHQSYPGQDYTCGAWLRTDVVVEDGRGEDDDETMREESGAEGRTHHKCKHARADSEKTVRLAHSGSNVRNYVQTWLFPELERAVVGFTNVGGVGASKGCEAVVQGLADGSLEA